MDKIQEAVEILQQINRRMIEGCGNHGCIIKQPRGMATDGPCRCSSRYIARELGDLAYSLAKTIVFRSSCKDDG